MKNIILSAIALMTLSTSALAQTTVTTQAKLNPPSGVGPVSAQSVNYTVTTTSVNILYLRDGLDTLTALSVPFFTFPNAPRLTANAIGAVNMNDLSHQIYAGTGLSYHTPIKGGYGLDIIAGLKGFDLADLKTGHLAGFTTGKGAWVLGVGITIPTGHSS